jgi:hypothetical protein
MEQNTHARPTIDPNIAVLAAKVAALESEVHALRGGRRRRTVAFLSGRATWGRLGRTVLVACLLGLTLGTNAFASIPDIRGTIHGCYANKTGELSVRDTATTHKCGSGMTALTWNQIGRVGPKGATGPRGVTGPKGSVGPRGAQGPQGIAGPQGSVGPQGPQGPTGNTGPQGDAGSPGLSGYQLVSGSASALTTPFQVVNLSVSCPGGKKAISGGFFNSQTPLGNLPSTATLTILQEGNIDAASANYQSEWDITVKGPDGPSFPTLTPYAVCVSIAN